MHLPASEACVIIVLPTAGPGSPPILDRLTAAFARASDARYALGILESSGAVPVRATLEEVRDERGAVSLIVLRVDLTGLDRARVLSAVSGGHGVPIPEPDTAGVGELVQVA